MKLGTFNQNWYSVPKGTVVKIIREYKILGIHPTYEVESLNGELLPFLSGPSKRTHVAVEFITIDEEG